MVLLLLAVIVLGVGAIYVVISQTDQDQLKDRLISQLGEATGLDVSVEGDTTIGFLWGPMISINKLVAKSNNDSDSAPLLSVENIYLDGDLIPFLLGNFEIKNIRLSSPVMTFYKGESGLSNLAGLSSSNTDQNFDIFDDALITIENATIRYQSVNHFIDNEISNINLSLEMDSIFGPYQMDGMIAGDGSNYNFTMESGKITTQGAQMIFAFQHQLFSFSFNGSFTSGEDVFESVAGVFEFNANDAAEFASHYLGRRKLFNHIPPESNVLKFSTQLELTNERISLRDIAFDSPENILNSEVRNKKAESQYNESYIEAYIGDERYMDVNLNIDRINLDNLFYLSEIRSLSMIDMEIPDFTIMFDLKANEVIYNSMPAKNVHVGAQLIGRGLELYPVTADIPGNGRFSMSGTLTKPPIRSESSIILPVFNGEFYLSGDDIMTVNQWTKFAPAIGQDSKQQFPFTAEGNLKVQPHRIEIFNLESVFNVDSNITGDAVLRHGAGRSKLSARLEINNIDIDELLELFDKNEQAQNEEDEFLASANEAIPLAIKIQRIARLPFNFDTELSFSRLVFNKKQFNNITAEITVSANRIALERIYIKARDNDFNAFLGLDLSDENPRLSTKIEGKKLNTSFFLKEQTREERILELEEKFRREQEGQILKESEEDKVLTIDRSIIWSTVPYDFSRMLLFDGTLEIKLDELIHKGITFDNLSVKGDISKNVLSVNNFTTGVFGGNLELFSMQITSVPTITTVFTYKMTNISINALLEQMLGKKDVIIGTANIAGSLGFAGNNTKSWISSMQGEFGIATSKLDVNGFNMDNIIDNVANAKSETDLNLLVSQSLSGKNDDKFFTFNSVSASGGIKKGQIALKSLQGLSRRYNVSTTGLVDIKNWLMSLQSTFIFVPTGRYIPQDFLQKENGGIRFNMRFTGDLDNPTINSSFV
ncbi:MAG: AsmA family protein, partial [Rickettsiales bacterium]|nr:AsmA family protein [Rickettsiales bacterium]